MSAARHPRFRSCAAACLIAALSGGVRATAAQTSLSSYNRAEDLHQALEQMPEAQRSGGDYERVLNAYRAVYHGDPASAKADASIAAVAGLLAEEGRIFHSQKDFRDAIGQYEFLRQQYPYSRYRFAALIAEGEIYQTGLADRDHAKEAFEKFLKTYPRNPLAEQARAGLAEIRDEEVFNGPPQRRPDAGQAASDEAAPVAGTLAAIARRPLSAAEDLPPAAIPPAGDGSAESDEAPGRLARVTGIRYWSNPSDTRIAISLEDQVQYGAARIPRPNRIYFDLRGARLAAGFKEESIPVGNDAMLTRIRAAQFSNDVTRIVLDVGAGVGYSAFFLPNPWRLIIDIHKPNASVASAPPMEAVNRASPAQSSRPPSALPRSSSSRSTRSRPGNELEGLASAPPAGEAAAAAGAAAMASSAVSEDAEDASPYAEQLPPARDSSSAVDGDRSLARTLGLKVGRIVIDAGHGGHDCGSLGPGGLEEKDITLDVALRLGRLLKNRLGAEIIYTRRDDTFVPLQTRTAIANAAHADLFISIHANSSADPTARGVESYYLNFTTAPDALEVAARENADSDESVANLSDLVKEITLKDKIEESREFAADVQRSLYDGLEAGNPGFRNRGVKKAPFVVLIGANMPSILAEISFLTNPDDARELRQPAYRERIAEALYRGVARYINGLNGVRLAENGVRPN